MKTIKIIILTLIIPFLSTAQEGTIQFNPEMVEVTEGETFEVEVAFNTAGASISVFDLHMFFVPQFLHVVSIETLQGDLFDYIQQPEFNNDLGKIDMAAYQIGKEIPTSDFSVVEITLLALSTVELTEITHPTNVFPETLLAYAGVNMLEEASPLKVTILGEALSDEFEEREADFGLEVWPNPGSEITQVKFNLPKSDRVQLSIYDVNGKLVKTIFEGEASKDVPYQFEVDLRNLADGTYACRLNSNTQYQTKMLVVAK